MDVCPTCKVWLLDSEAARHRKLPTYNVYSPDLEEEEDDAVAVCADWPENAAESWGETYGSESDPHDGVAIRLRIKSSTDGWDKAKEYDVTPSLTLVWSAGEAEEDE